MRGIIYIYIYICNVVVGVEEYLDFEFDIQYLPHHPPSENVDRQVYSEKVSESEESGDSDNEELVSLNGRFPSDVESLNCSSTSSLYENDNIIIQGDISNSINSSESEISEEDSQCWNNWGTNMENFSISYDSMDNLHTFNGQNRSLLYN